MSGQIRPDAAQWAEAARWIARADDDLRVVDVLIAQPDPPLLPAALHCQQAAEKIAKAVLIAANIAPPRIHDIDKLAGLVTAVDVGIGSTLSELGELTIWFAAARYPDTFEIALSEHDIGSALSKLQALRERVNSLAPKV
jgi:HEPN domain-containing protein